MEIMWRPPIQIHIKRTVLYYITSRTLQHTFDDISWIQTNFATHDDDEEWWWNTVSVKEHATPEIDFCLLMNNNKKMKKI